MSSIKIPPRFTCDGKEYITKYDENNSPYVLGKGGGGVVYKATSGGKEYAVKIFVKDKKKTSRFNHEIDFLKNKAKECHYLVNIYGTCYDDITKNTFLIMDVFPKTLRDYINESNEINKNFCVVFQLIMAIEFLHVNGIIHRDLKPENVLMDEHNNVYLSDFGIAHFPEFNITNSCDFLANANYMAPEAHVIGDSKNATTSVDIYSLGKIVNEIFTKENLVGTHGSRIQDTYPELIWMDELIECMMYQNPNERPKIKDVKISMTFHYSKYRNELLKIKRSISSDTDCSISSSLIDYVTVDFLRGQEIFDHYDEYMNLKLNHNYHMNVHYMATERFKNYYFQYLILEACKIKFNIESNGLLLERGNTELISLKETAKFDEFRSILEEKYPLPNGFNDLSGKILKYFSSCRDYHCEELISKCKEIEKKTEDLDDVPFIYFLMKTIDCLRTSNSDIKLSSVLLCNWEMSCEKTEEPNLFSVDYSKEDSGEILVFLKERYNCFVEKYDYSYGLLFNEDDYADFAGALKRGADEKITSIMYIDSDVDSLLRIKNHVNKIVEIEASNFDLQHTVAKLLLDS